MPLAELRKRLQFGAQGTCFTLISCETRSSTRHLASKEVWTPIKVEKHFLPDVYA